LAILESRFTIETQKPLEKSGGFFNTPEQSEQNLKGLIKQGTSNIKANCFDVGIIKNLEKEIIENGYKLQFIPTSIESFADFYLAKF
jgi:hypothetical protein